MARPALLWLLPIALLAAPAGCGSGETKTPVACLNGSAAYIKALQAAPGEVRLAPDVPISACLTNNQSGGDLGSVGAAMVGAATALNAQARRQPQLAVEPGFLVGAAARGAADTGGIHATLLERLRAAARYSPGGAPLPRRFELAYGRGYAAGKDHG